MSLRLHVELVYDLGCPNVDRARESLAHALQETGVPAVWTEWRTDDPACPERLRGYGSPTVLVNGADVAPGPHPWTRHGSEDGPRCRLYREDDRVLGSPPPRLVREAVLKAVAPDVV